MKVITRGYVKEKIYSRSCQKCNSVLEFSQKDGVVIKDRNEVVLKVKCPVCSSQIYTVM